MVNAFRAHGYKTVTLLREPMSRVQSAANKMWRTGQQPVILSPDLTTSYLTGCNAPINVSTKQAVDGPPSCTMEFARSTDPVLRKVGEDIIEKVSQKDAACHSTPGASGGRRNATAAEGAKLLSMAKEELRGFDIVGTIENFPSVLKAFAAKFKMKADLPRIVSIHPSACGEAAQAGKTCHENLKKTFPLPQAELATLLKPDKALWDQATAQLQGLATRADEAIAANPAIFRALDQPEVKLVRLPGKGLVMIDGN